MMKLHGGAGQGGDAPPAGARGFPGSSSGAGGPTIEEVD